MTHETIVAAALEDAPVFEALTARAEQAEARVAQLEKALHHWWGSEQRWMDAVNDARASYETRAEAQRNRLRALDALEQYALEVVKRLPHNRGL